MPALPPAAMLGLGYRFGGIKRMADIVGLSFAAEIFGAGRQFRFMEKCNPVSRGRWRARALLRAHCTLRVPRPGKWSVRQNSTSGLRRVG